MSSSSYEYIIVGGGVAGLTLAARLSKLLPPNETDNKRVLVLEAGTDPSTTECITNAMGQHMARESQHAYTLDVAANPHLGGRVTQVPVGKALSGSAAINGSAWTRGPKVDYDYWANLVGDDDWSYDKLLPYFKKTEQVIVGEGEGQVEIDEAHHGYEGTLKAVPMKANWPKRKYPLREPVRKAWEEAGVKYNPDGNNGNQNGLTEMVEVWVQGRRQLPNKILDLSLVDVRDVSTVHRVTFDTTSAGEPVANGVDLVGGEHIAAIKEVIVSAGVYHTPQVLMLSGIGDPAVLEKFGIATVSSNVEVGKNLMDHLAVGLTWKLKHPEQGLAIGSPLFVDPSYFAGWPMDFIEFGPLDDLSQLEPLIKNQEDKKYLLRPDSSHMEVVSLYAALGKRLAGIDAAMDGSHISTLAVCLTTTSRGSVMVRSAHPEDPPIIDPNFNETETDRFILREALRKASAVFLETETGQSFVSHEVPPEGYATITKHTPDAEIDKRIRDFGYSLDHPMGSCSMGKVVDSHCRVKGLRVVDASVLPIPVACHIQAATYALAERVADWVGNGQ
ncbi:uncharacterized protein Z518_06800 [Rhinocladiella mackenziei CBS 650.93]|uniref:Glucose-methanol-choline oxidoreductase N-terminal domain-containing protein n=1 Tax=Rhinocladiella mackenziei CBS 650.93 TaxID=1442369 RepID=A0A0D2GYF9_9EURO|nr:uncharacterized protein Z518_06800 [Rhinocladiella mackenziei CBS 650.93]KIX03248.1 hypothetical protein Z518_06800 [Rhinocladiella mackenziei CBS 650.93]